MKGDPLFPIRFKAAIEAVSYRLGSNAGLDIRALQIAEEEPSPSPEAEALKKEQEEQADFHYSEAEIRVLGLVIQGELRAWTVQGEDWKRPTPKALQNRMRRAKDEPWGLYVDEKEITAKFADRWPTEFASWKPSAKPATEAKPEPGKRGRRVGSGGFVKSDPPLVKEMVELFETGLASSIHAASMVVGKKAGGINTSLESKGKRLVRRLNASKALENK